MMQHDGADRTAERGKDSSVRGYVGAPGSVERASDVGRPAGPLGVLLVTASGDTIAPADLGLGDSSPVAISDEKQQIAELLRRFHGSVSQVAKSLGLSRQALYRKMERLGIVLERRPKE